MIVRFGLCPRRAGLATDTFQMHWRELHGPLIAAKLKNVKRYWQNHAVLRDGETLLPWPGFDACAETEFDDMAVLGAAFADEEYRREADRDSDRLIDRPRFAALCGERVLATGRIDTSGVRLMTFIRRAPQRTARELTDALCAVVQATGAYAREIFIALEGAAAPVSPFDAVETQWFEVPEQAERYVTSREAREHRHCCAHAVRGVERLIARVVTFV